MSKTSAVTLFPVQSKPASASSSKSAAASDDASFRATLEGVRQQKAAKKSEADKPERATAAAPKRSAKSARPKRVNAGARGKAGTADVTGEDREEAEVTGESAVSSLDDAPEGPAEVEDHSDTPGEHETSTETNDPAMNAAGVGAQPSSCNETLPGGEPQEIVDESDGAATATQGVVVDAAMRSAAGQADQAAGEAGEPGATPESMQARGIGTSKVVSGGLVEADDDSFGEPSAGASSANPTTSAPATIASLQSSMEEAFGAIEDAIGAADAADDQGRATRTDDASPLTATFEQDLQRATSATGPAKSAAAAPLDPQVQFVDTNHPKIVSGMRSELLPNGGTMRIRLDPPELGALQVTVHLRDGVMTASFETSNDEATRMLSHSLNQLKTVLEAGGVSVEKLHVQQSPKQESQAGQEQQQGGSREQQQEARQEQQRREMLQRMWRKLAGAGDPIDFVA